MFKCHNFVNFLGRRKILKNQIHRVNLMMYALQNGKFFIQIKFIQDDE